MNKSDPLRWDLEKELLQKGCAICRLSYKGVTRYVDSILYESVNDPGIREQVRTGLGFCNRHAWQMRESNGNSLGLAFLGRSALDEWQRQLEEVKSSDRQTLERLREQFLRSNQSAGQCLACDKQVEIETSYLETLFQALKDPVFLQGLRASEGLCRAHFIQSGKVAPDGKSLQRLLEVEKEIN